MPVHSDCPGLRYANLPDPSGLAVYFSAEEPARPDANHLSGFSNTLQECRDVAGGAPPEVSKGTVLSGVFGGLDSRRQDQGAPPSLETHTAPRPNSPEGPGGGLIHLRLQRFRELDPIDPFAYRYNRGSLRFSPAFTRAGEWPGRPSDAAPDVDPLGEASATFRATALAPAPAAEPARGDTKPVRGGRLTGPARASVFDHYPSTMFLPRCAEVSSASPRLSRPRVRAPRAPLPLARPPPPRAGPVLLCRARRAGAWRAYSRPVRSYHRHAVPRARVLLTSRKAASLRAPLHVSCGLQAPPGFFLFDSPQSRVPASSRTPHLPRARTMAPTVETSSTPPWTSPATSSADTVR